MNYLPSFLSPLLSYFVQDPKKTSRTRKQWYQRATIEVATLWKTIAKSNSKAPNRTSPPKSHKFKKCTSSRGSVATSLTRLVCLCAPISSSYADIFRGDVPPRRSTSYSPRSKPISGGAAGLPEARSSGGGRRRVVFRGKSLSDDVLMRRFVAEEAMMQSRRRNQMEVIRKSTLRRRRRRLLGPSRLCRMVMAEEDSL